jgi:Tripartite tricarboxylate transporter TctB family
MKVYDQGSSLFWLLFSIFVFIESNRLGIGTPQNPETGFISFGASGLLAILSIILFLQSSLKKEGAKIKSPFQETLWKRVFLVLIALLLYTKLMPFGGYLISTFLLMTFLFFIVERQKMRWVLGLSSLSTLVTYYVFSKWLNCQFPPGLFGF